MNTEDGGINPSRTFEESQSENAPDVMANTTNFHNESGVRNASIAGEHALDPIFFKDPEQMEQTTLAFYLSRPTKIQASNGTTTAISSSNTVTSFTPLTMPQAMLTLPIYANKPRGRFGFRATMVFRLVVNAERFHQGRYLLTYCPLGGCSFGTNLTEKGNAWVNKHSATLMQRSQLPHVEFDLNCDTEVTLRVPYSSVHDFYQFSWANTLTTGVGSWGVLRLYPYVPLAASGGSTSCDWTIYGHFEDIEFVGFSSTNITSQSDSPFTSSVKKKNPVDAERRANNVGPVQSMATSVGKVARYLAPIPLLSNFSGQVAWASDIVSNVASVFGWSSPLNIEKSSRMNITNFAYASNVNKIDNSLPIGLTTNNQVAVAPGFSSTNIDELDIVKMASIPAYYRTTTWSDSTIVGYELTTLSLYPYNFKTTTSYNGVNYNNYTPLAYCGKMFGLWRGSIVIKIKIVKTEFHSGRLCFAFWPPDGTSRTLADTDYLHREIIDIREKNEITLTIPYTAPTTYRNQTEDIGTLGVYVVDRLVAPSTVSSSVSLIFEVSGGPDIEFAVPTGFEPVTGSGDFTVQSSSPFKASVDCTAIAKTIGATSNPVFQLDTSQLCIGERILSFRQLLKRFVGLYHGTLASNNYYSVLPFAAPTLNTTTGVDTFGVYGDLYAELCNIFMYSRGGVRLKVLPSLATPKNFGAILCTATNLRGSSSSMIQTQLSNGGTSGDSSLPNMTAFSNYVLVDGDRTRDIEVEIPQYIYNKSRNNAGALVSVGNNYKATVDSPNVCVDFFAMDYTNTKTPLSTAATLRAGADDCNFGLFVSIPPFAENPTT